MNGQEIIEMAKQAGLLDEVNGWDVWFPDELEAFAKLVAAKEREACAKVCEKIVDRPAGYNGQWEGYGNTKTHMTGYECAAAIRARGQA